MKKMIKWNFISKFVICFSFLLLCFVFYKTCFKSDEEYIIFNFDANLVKASLDSIQRGLDFFSNIEEDDVVFDMLIGIRIVMEQGWLLTTYLNQKDGVKDLIGTLNELVEKSNDLFDKIYDVLMRTDNDYMNGTNECMI